MPTSVIGQLVLIVVVIGLIYLGIKATTPHRASNERGDDVAELGNRRLEVENEKSVFIEQARSLMPDRDATLRRLLERYSWQQLLMSLSMSKLHMELLRDVKRNPKVTLPNLENTVPSRLERQAIAEARKLARTVGYESLWDSLIQVATTNTLSDLRFQGLVTTDPTVNDNERTYKVKPTPKGRRVIDIDKSYSNIASGITSTNSFASFNERKLVCRLFSEIIGELDEHAS